MDITGNHTEYELDLSIINSKMLIMWRFKSENNELL